MSAGDELTLSPTQTILLTFAAFGAVVGAHVGSLPFLVEASGVSPLVFGIAGAVGMLANIVAMSIGGFINRHADHRKVLLIVLPLVYLALVLALLVSAAWSFVLSFLVLSAGLGMTDLFMNAEASAVEEELGRPAFSSYHGSASLSVAGFAILGSLVSAATAPWFCALLVAVPMALAWAAIHKFIPARHDNHHEERAQPVALPRKVLTYIGIAAGLNVACEVAAIQWAGQLLTSIAPELAAISGLGVALYGLCGGSMRMFGDGLRARHGDRLLMIIGIFVAILGFVTLGFAPGFAISVLAFAAVGSGLSLTFPCLFSLAGKIAPEGRAAAMGYVSAVGGAPRVVLPWVLGWLAAQYSLSAVFAACAFVAAGALVIIIFSYAKAEALASSK